MVERGELAQVSLGRIPVQLRADPGVAVEYALTRTLVRGQVLACGQVYREHAVQPRLPLTRRRCIRAGSG
jgi:hypothetical protein